LAPSFLRLRLRKKKCKKEKERKKKGGKRRRQYQHACDIVFSCMGGAYYSPLVSCDALYVKKGNSTPPHQRKKKKGGRVVEKRAGLSDRGLTILSPFFLGGRKGRKWKEKKGKKEGGKIGYVDRTSPSIFSKDCRKKKKGRGER